MLNVTDNVSSAGISAGGQSIKHALPACIPMASFQREVLRVYVLNTFGGHEFCRNIDGAHMICAM